MIDNGATATGPGMVERSGLLHIFRVLGMALQPAKLGLGLAALIATFLFGSALDLLAGAWGGVDEHAIDRFVMSRDLGQPYESMPGEYGPFEVWRKHAERGVFGLMGSSVPGIAVAEGTPLGAYFARHASSGPLRNITGLFYGAWWMAAEHTAFFVVFAAGCLLIWSFGGGAICRLAAVQFARDEKLTAVQGVRYARQHLLDGFVLAPCIPLVFALLAALILVIGGALLRVPLLGDIVFGMLFPLAVLGGFIIAILLIGLLVGGNLMWPAVAAEGQDAFDAFARSLSYAFTKPWKTLLYAIIALILVSLAWVFVNLFTWFALELTHGLVSFGASWWNRGTPAEPVNKLELLWTVRGPAALYDWPQWGRLAWYEFISAFFIGLTVLLVVGLMFSFLVSFYYCAATVLYFLLRRDVDKTELEDVFVEETVGGDAQAVADRIAAARRMDAPSPP